VESWLPATGLTPRELLDTSGIAAAFQSLFLGNREFTNLPRKFNVTITGCLEHCTGGETQDISMTPALAGTSPASTSPSAASRARAGRRSPRRSTPSCARRTPPRSARRSR